MDLEVRPDPARVGQYLVQRILSEAESAIASRGTFVLGLSGGSVLQLLAEQLPMTVTRTTLPHNSLSINTVPEYGKWYVVLVDERVVPLSEASSNCGEAWRLIFGKLSNFSADHLFGLDVPNFPKKTGDPIDLENSARSYDSALQYFYEKTGARISQSAADGAWPEFDLLVLGMGPDGHTASLFPRHVWYEKDLERFIQGSHRPVSPARQRIQSSISAMDDDPRLHHWTVLVEHAPKPPSTRISMTLPCFVLSEHLLFVAMGNEKAEPLKRVYETMVQPPVWQDGEWVKNLSPVSAVTLLRKEKGRRVTWIVDEETARSLPS